MKKQHLFKNRLFSSIFYTKQSKYDTIVTSFWIFLLSTLRDFVPHYYHAKFGDNWTTNKGETERGTVCPLQPNGSKIPQPE